MSNPHFSSGRVQRAKRERAWKSPHARKGPPRVAFSRVGWFSRSLAFRSLYYPLGKMRTTRSLHSFRTIQLTACTKPTKTQKSKWIKLNKETIFHIFCILGAMMSVCRFYLTYLRVFQGIPGFSTCWRLHSYITKFKLNMSGWVTWLSKDTILYYSKYEAYISQNIKLSNTLSWIIGNGTRTNERRETLLRRPDSEYAT